MLLKNVWSKSRCPNPKFYQRALVFFLGVCACAKHSLSESIVHILGACSQCPHFERSCGYYMDVGEKPKRGSKQRTEQSCWKPKNLSFSGVAASPLRILLRIDLICCSCFLWSMLWLLHLCMLWVNVFVCNGCATRPFLKIYMVPLHWGEQPAVAKTTEMRIDAVLLYITSNILLACGQTPFDSSSNVKNV